MATSDYVICGRCKGTGVDHVERWYERELLFCDDVCATCRGDGRVPPGYYTGG